MIMSNARFGRFHVSYLILAYISICKTGNDRHSDFAVDSRLFSNVDTLIEVGHKDSLVGRSRGFQQVLLFGK